MSIAVSSCASKNTADDDSAPSEASVENTADDDSAPSEARVFWERVFSRDTYRLYKPEVLQGNASIVDQTKLKRLKLNLTRQQVAFLLGKPLTPNLFRRDRWDYIYYKIPTEGKKTFRRMTLFFKNNLLEHICTKRNCRAPA